MFIFRKNDEIDREKWDRSIVNSGHKLLYAYSWFLDVVSPGWQAYISEGYENCFPLPVKRRFGFQYLVQPNFTKQLGIFSTNILAKDIESVLYKNMFERFKYIRMSLHKNSSQVSYPGASISLYKNHELKLGKPYSELRRNYKRRAAGNINRAIKYGITCKNDIDKNIFLQFALKNLGPFSKKETKRLNKCLVKLCDVIPKHLDVKYIGAFNDKKELVAVSMYVIDTNRIYCMINSSNKTGKESQAMYMLTDYFLQQNAERERILDFTGSNIPGVAYFLESFGAKAFEYQFIYYKKPFYPFIN